MLIQPEEDMKFLWKQLLKIAVNRLIYELNYSLYHCKERFRPSPSKCVSIRDIEDGNFAVVDITCSRNIVLKEFERSHAFFTIYEGVIAANAFEFIELLIQRALERVCACNCIEGCIECNCDGRRTEKNMLMSKAGAEVTWKSLIGIEIDVEAAPICDEEEVLAGVETVIFASEVMGRNGRRVTDKQFDLVDGLRIEKNEDDDIVTKDELED